MPEGAKHFAVCQVCGRKALAAIHAKVDGGRSYTLHPVGRPKSADVKKVRSVRLSDADMRYLESGALRLVVVNNRITVIG